MCVGMVSGSGAANAITIGSATIPAMIASNIPPATAAAIESASSLGGQLMPPVMGIAAFLMAEFLGVDYFDVVARGWVPALIYYATVATSVYLLAITFRTRIVITKIRRPGLARHRQPRRLRHHRRRPGRLDGDPLPRADVRRALHILHRRQRPGRDPRRRPAAYAAVDVRHLHQADPDISRRLYGHDLRSGVAAGDAVDHDRGAGDHRRADQAWLPADRRRPASISPPWC